MHGQWVLNPVQSSESIPEQKSGQWVSDPVQGQYYISGAQLAALQVFTLPGTIVEQQKQAGSEDPDWKDTFEAVHTESEDIDPDFSIKDGILLFDNRYVLPSDQALKLRVLKANHNSRVAGHFGQYKTLERLRQNFCPRIEEETRDFALSCDVCQRDKASRRRRYGLLQPLEVPHRPWKLIAMDLITGLPESGGYTQIWVAVDRLSKMAYFIPMVTGAESPAKDLAMTFAREIWGLHSFPADIVSDRGSVFISSFWKELMEHLGVELNMSTAFHPQTDGQTERVNQILETYLRHYASFQQDD